MFNRNCSDISQQRFPAIHYHLGGGGQVAERLLGLDPRGGPHAPPPSPPLVQLLPVCMWDGCVKRDEKDNKGALGNFEGWWIYVHCLHCGSIQMLTIIQLYTLNICSLL